jgi:hypothetical protein
VTASADLSEGAVRERLRSAATVPPADARESPALPWFDLHDGENPDDADEEDADDADDADEEDADDDETAELALPQPDGETSVDQPFPLRRNGQSPA